MLKHKLTNLKGMEPNGYTCRLDGALSGKNENKKIIEEI